MPSLDVTDRKILNLLQADSSITNKDLAAAVGVAPATSLERVRRLKERGVLRREVALVNGARVGLGTIAFVSVVLASHASEAVAAFRDEVQKLEPVLECYHTAGESDYLLKVVAADIEGYETVLLDQLTAIPNVSRIRTSFVLSTVKHETRLPLDAAR